MPAAHAALQRSRAVAEIRATGLARPAQSFFYGRIINFLSGIIHERVKSPPSGEGNSILVSALEASFAAGRRFCAMSSEIGGRKCRSAQQRRVKSGE